MRWFPNRALAAITRAAGVLLLTGLVIAAIAGCRPSRPPTWEWGAPLPCPEAHEPRRIDLYVSDIRIPDMDRGEFKDEIMESWKRWKSHFGAYADIRLRLIDTTGVGVEEDGLNVITTCGTGAFPANTEKYFSEIARRTLEFDIGLRCRSGELWANCDPRPPSTPLTVLDVCEVVTHEWGHVLGMGECEHSDRRLSAMSDDPIRFSCTRFKLSRKDKEIARTLFRHWDDSEPCNDYPDRGCQEFLLRPGIPRSWDSSIGRPMDQDIYKLIVQGRSTDSRNLRVSITAPFDLPIEARVYYRLDYFTAPKWKARWILVAAPGDTDQSPLLSAEPGAWYVIVKCGNSGVLEPSFSDRRYHVEARLSR